MEHRASVIIVSYNSRKFIDVCIRSVLENGPLEIIVVDNASTDGTPDLIRSHYGNVKLVVTGENIGFGAGNNLGVKYAAGEYLVFLNPDTIMEAGCLKALLAPLNNRRVITTPKVMLYDGSVINTCGNVNHFTGLTFVRGLYEEASTAYCESGYVSGISGACFAMKRAHYQELGGFDETFFLYAEDSDFSWRALLKDYRILYVHNAAIRHHYSFRVPPEKVYLVEKARYIILRKYLNKKDVLALLPSLIISELLTWGYVIGLGRKGIFHKYRAIKDGLTIKVQKTQGDKKHLFTYLEAQIPMVRLTRSRFEIAARRFCNLIFMLNFNSYVKRYASRSVSSETC